MSKPITLVVGLGNESPLAKGVSPYFGTIHNVGADTIYYLSAHVDQPFRFYQHYKSFILETHQVTFAILNSYMNCSGIPLKVLMSKLHISVDEILIIHDDIELPSGRMSFKQNGGHKGHNGLRSIITELSTNEFNRLRIGVDRVDKNLLHTYVLTKPNPTQQTLIKECMNYFIHNLDQVLQRQFHGIILE